MSIKKRVKRLENVKGKTTKVGVGTPTSLEGKNGDIHVRETPTGTALFAKINGRWHKFSADPEPTPIIAAQESIDANGYMTFSNGLIIQWGKSDGGLGEEASFNLDFTTDGCIDFPNNIFSVVVTLDIDPSTSENQALFDFWLQVKEVALTGFEVMYQWNGVGSVTDWDRPFYWIAIGN